MSDETQSDQSPEEPPPPKIQELFERPILLLVLGFVVMVVFYTLWGIFEIATLPPSELP